jgi:hypothetical protein
MWKPSPAISAVDLLNSTSSFTFGVTARDAPVGVTDPEPQQIFRHSLLAKMSHTVSLGGMEAALLAAHLSQDLV